MDFKKLTHELLTARNLKGYTRDYVTLLMKKQGINYNSSSLLRLEREEIKSIKPSVLKALCEIYEIDKTQMFILAGFIDSEEIKKQLNDVDTDMVRLPVSGLASAGRGVIDFDELIEEEFIIPIDMKIPKMTRVVTIHGDSMEPIFFDEDKLLLEPINNPTNLEEWKRLNNKIVTIILNEERYVKKLLFLDQKMYLYSFNKEIYPKIEVREGDSIYCEGIITYLIQRNIKNVPYKYI